MEKNCILHNNCQNTLRTVIELEIVPWDLLYSLVQEKNSPTYFYGENSLFLNNFYFDLPGLEKLTL